MDEKKPKRKYRGSLVWPLILISIGVALLLSNIGAFSVKDWDLIWRLWPVILIAIGLNNVLQNRGIAGPVFLIGLGAIILLNNLGIILLDPWIVISRLWPLLIIAIGLDIIFGRRNVIASIIGSIATLALLGAAVWIIGSESIQSQELSTEKISQVLGIATEAEITIAPSVGDLVIMPLTDSQQLIEGYISLDRIRNVRSEFSMEDSTAIYSLRSEITDFLPGDKNWDWILGLTSNIPIELDASQGVGDIDITLSGMNLSYFDLDQGVGRISVRLPSTGHFQANIRQAIGQIIVELPRDVPIRIDVNKALSTLSRPDNLTLQGEYLISPDYDESEYKIDLEINQAIGNITILYNEDW